jgi:hypothetical protein
MTSDPKVQYDLKRIPIHTLDYVNREIRNNFVPRKPHDVHKTIKGSTAPLSTIIGKGPKHLMTKCLCGKSEVHVSFFEAMKQERGLRYEIDDFCHNRNTFIVGKLPLWLTGLSNKKEFVDLPSVYYVYHVFSRGTFWWRKFSGQKDKFMNLSREARLLLYACTGQPLEKLLFLDTKGLMLLKCNRAALGRVRNWFITLDGILISVLLGSQGHPEICNWEFFDRIMQTYLKSAVSDLFKVKKDDFTYYARLKEFIGFMKDKVLKEI